MKSKEAELMDTVVAAAKDGETIDARLAETLALLEKQKGINADLEACARLKKNAWCRLQHKLVITSRKSALWRLPIIGKTDRRNLFHRRGAVRGQKLYPR